MILGSVSLIDCLVFLIFLAPQLIINVGLFPTASWVFGALPFLLIQLPYGFIRERYFTAREKQAPFVKQATAFQDLVIRCVRYAFACMPAYIGRVFFSKPVALPFLRFRMLRHGHLKPPIEWREIQREGFSGIYITPNHHREPDVVIYYCHGGGFSMGSSYFYMEFLIAWVALLRDAGFKNPALFALEYTLVPDACYPVQVRQALAGYDFVLSLVQKSTRICLGGDSAGGTLMLSLLLSIADSPDYENRRPGLITLISPWVTLVSDKNRNTRSDYLDQRTLDLYGRQYAGPKVSVDDPLVSPGKCKDLARWRRASPKFGWSILYGAEEVFAPETEDLIKGLEKCGVAVDVERESGGIHAWPVASLYLGETREKRLKGIRSIVGTVRKRME